MLLLRKFRKLHSLQSFCHSTVTVETPVNDALEKELYKPKIHPGIVKPKLIEVPANITAAIKKALKDAPVKTLVQEGAALSRYLYARKAPLEENEVHKKRDELERNILQGIGYGKLADVPTEDSFEVEKYLNKQIDIIYSGTTYLWKPIVYDEYKVLTYAMGRSALEYAVVQRVFNEIAQRHPDFKPSSFFDFGAGVGTGTWAASQLWKQSLYEYFLVDNSREMNELSDLILRGGDANKHMSLKNVYYRQFLPASSDVKFSLVLSAYTLMELPDMRTRIETLLNLWNKCDGYLVLIEQGSGAGFKLINEARDFLRNHLQDTKSGYVYAPCPHEKPCPRSMDSKDKTPCNFLSKHQPLRIGEPSATDISLYSYLILKKGERTSEDSSIEWPRVVRPIQIGSRHVICRTCTHRGELERFVVTKGKNTKWTYRCSRKTEWGDRLPFLIEDEPKDSVADGKSGHRGDEQSGDTLHTDTENVGNTSDGNEEHSSDISHTDKHKHD